MLVQYITFAFTLAGFFYIIKWLSDNKEKKGHIANTIHNKGWFVAVLFILGILFMIANGALD